MLDEKLLPEKLSSFIPESLIETNNLERQCDIENSVIAVDGNNIDLAKVNFLNMLNNDQIKRSSETIIRKYGVGTCGPRAFYGTTDVHLELEKSLAEFFGLEEAIVYSYGFVAISSSIAAYCKRKDIVFIDKEANFPIQQGLVAAKCKIVYFNHNDSHSLYDEANKIVENEKYKSCRKFLIVEGVSWKTGKLLPLDMFLKVAEEFKMRVFLDETYSFGIFGDNGKGLTEHFNIDPTRLDMIIGTLESAIGSIGGFCVGSKLTIDHQRLAGSGYIFSASLPTFLVQVCLEALNCIQNKPQKLRNLAKEVHTFLEEMCNFKVESHPESAFKVFRSTNRDKNVNIFQFCKKNGVHFIHNKNGLIINLNVSLAEDHTQLDYIYTVLKNASEL